MRKMRTKIGAMIASAMLAVAMMAMPAGAATAYTGVAGGEFTFDKYLISRTSISKFSSEVMTSKYEQLYKSCLR